MRVFSNLAVSVDGKIADRHRPHKTLGTKADKALMEKLRAEADVIVFGANTLRASPQAVKHRRRGKRQPVNAVITASGELDPNMPFWDDEDVLRFVFTTASGLDRALASARDRAFVVATGETVDPARVLARFRDSGLENILVEGGGEIIALFLGARLLQEMYVTVTPWILGGRANPALAGGEGLDPWTQLKLSGVKRVKDEVYFRYEVKGAKRV